MGGLVGSRGILPAAEQLDWVRSQVGAERYWAMPTVFWLGASDNVLTGVAWLGALFALLLALGFAPALLLTLLWALYLSIVTVGSVFFGYQWDALLLETGLLAVFLAPLSLRLGRGREPSRLALWLLRFLLFRLTFASGVVKLVSGDPTWRSLLALLVHYETQPLPTWLGWYAHQLPAFAQRASCAAMFVVELAVPFLIFGPRRARLFAFFPLVGLQLLIALTGNYAFFNLLTIALCTLLLDDAALLWLRQPETIAGRPWPRVVIVPVGAVTGLLASVMLLSGCGVDVRWPRPVVALYRIVAPFRSVNGYGLFAVMTTRRAEIVVEGTVDGVTWKPYVFRDKPGDLTRAPRFVAPHQPRLDWQMWFAALSTCEETPWFPAFLDRLREGSPAVLGLLAGNPFPGGVPRAVRARLEDYRFTDFATRRATGAWWHRTPNGLYCHDEGEQGESSSQPPD